MKEFNGYKAEVSKSADRLPVGNYVVRFMDAEEQSYDWGNVLAIKFDIAEGEYADFFSNKYAMRNNPNEKYKGVFRLNIPTGDGSDKDKWNIHRFNNFMGCLERDNPGFKWHWNEKALVGLKAGMIFREREWAYDGKTGFYTEAYNVTLIELLDETNTPRPKMLSAEQKAANGVKITIDKDDEFTTVDTEAGDLPF